MFKLKIMSKDAKVKGSTNVQSQVENVLNVISAQQNEVENESTFIVLNDEQIANLSDEAFNTYCDELALYEEAERLSNKKQIRTSQLHLGKQDSVLLWLYNEALVGSGLTVLQMYKKGLNFTDSVGKISPIGMSGLKRDWDIATTAAHRQIGAIRITAPSEYFNETQRGFDNDPVKVRIMTKTQFTRPDEMFAMGNTKLNNFVRIVGDASDLKKYLLNNGAKDEDFNDFIKE